MHKLFHLNRHALGTGLYGFDAAGFFPGPLAVDHAGIIDAAGHEDVQIPAGTAFYLPAGQWVCTQNYEGDGWGLTLAFRPQQHTHEICFMHMNSVSRKLAVGGVYRGGMYLGQSGGLPGVSPGVDAAHSQGAHLHLAYSFEVKQAIKSLYGRKAFTSSESTWAYGQALHAGGMTFHRGHTRIKETR